MVRGRMGWVMGVAGAVLIAVAIWAWQGPGEDAGVSHTPAIHTPLAVSTAATPVQDEPGTAAAISPLTPPLISPLAGARSGLAPQPASPLESEASQIWLPTVVADGPEPTPTEPEPTPSPTPTPDPDAPVYAPVYTVEVLNTYPHDPGAFTQGLEYRDGELFEGTGLRGQSTLRRVDLETGEVLQRVALASRYFGEGITVFGDRIFQLTWQSGEGFIYDRETFEQVGSVAYNTEGWGLTHDGERLIMSDGTARLYFRDPETFELLDSVDVTDGGDLIVRLNELEYIEGEIWANIWLTDRIARIDPQTGQVVAWLDLAGLLPPEQRVNGDAVLNGIAYDAEGERIFVTGKLWPSLFEIAVVNSE